MPTFSGISKDLIGVKYDVGIGFDDGSGDVVMYGYVMPEGGNGWSQSPNIQDEGSLVSVSSPNQIDRYLTNWPKATQGDWSHGEEQFVFIDPQRYYSSDGNIDVSVPGKLRLLPSYTETTYTLTGTWNLVPTDSDMFTVWAGVKDNAGNNWLQIAPDGSIQQFSVGDGEEIIDMLSSPGGYWFGTLDHIYGFAGEPGAPTLGTTLDQGVGPGFKSFAYFDDAIYFLSSDQTVINTIDPGMTVAPFLTRGDGFFETTFTGIASTANGILYVTALLAIPPIGTAGQWNVLYYYDGSAGSTSRIQDIAGRFVYMWEIEGITYLLAIQTQQAGDSDVTIYQLQGTSLTVLLDMREVDPAFQSIANLLNTNIPEIRASITGDGRFLYFGWPGLYGARIDLVSGGIAKIGSPPVPAPAAQNLIHRIVKTESGLVDFQVVDDTLTVRIFYGLATTGSLIMSDLDFGAPGEDKCFKSIRFELNEPLPAGSSVVMTYDIDHSGTFTGTTQIQTSSTTYYCLIPANAMGRVLTVQVTMTANGDGEGPTINLIGADATLGRCFKATLQCNVNQQTLDGSGDTQATAQQRLGIIDSIWNKAGRRSYLYVQSLSDPDLVETVPCTLESYEFKNARAMATDVNDVEGTMDVTFNEALGADIL